MAGKARRAESTLRFDREEAEIAEGMAKTPKKALVEILN